jgi:hypothetical protein
LLVRSQSEFPQSQDIAASKAAISANDFPSNRYDLAILYLDQAEYDLDAAVEAYMEDERWEREHPLAKVKRQR